MGSLTYAQEEGPREAQEDRLFFKEFGNRRYKKYVLAVMDGHGGCSAAELCRKELERIFAKPFGRVEDVESRMRMVVDQLARATFHLNSGTTLSIVCVCEKRDEAVVVILGDSPVLILTKNDELKRSPEHNVRTNEAERQRAVTRGGYFDGQYLRYKGQGIQLTRALGNRDFNGALSKEPEIYKVAKPKLVIVASDGLIDPSHLGDDCAQEAVRLCHTGAGAAELMRWKRELRDNASVIV